jgi:hypothetical protein
MNTIKVDGTGDPESRIASLEQAVNYGEVILPFTVVGEAEGGGTGGTPTGPAGGDLTGTYPNPTIGPGAVGNAEISDVAYSKVTGAPTIPTTLPPTGPAGGDLAGSYPNPTIAALAVGNAEISDVAYAKVTGAPTSLPPSGAAGGDLAGTYPAPTIAAGAVGNAEISDVAWAKVTGAPTAFPPSGSAGGDLTGAYPNPTIAAGAVGNAEITDVAWAKVTGTPTSLPPSGAAGGDLTGTYPNPTLAANAVGTADIGNLQVTDAKINDVAWSKVTGAPASFPPSGTASGDLSGTYPGPTVAKVKGAALGTTTPLARGDLLVADATPALKRLALGAASTVLQSNGTDAVWGTSLGGPPSGPAGGSLAGTYPNPTLTTTGVTAAAYGDARNIPQVTVNAEGRVTAVVVVKIIGQWK